MRRVTLHATPLLSHSCPPLNLVRPFSLLSLGYESVNPPLLSLTAATTSASVIASSRRCFSTSPSSCYPSPSSATSQSSSSPPSSQQDASANRDQDHQQNTEKKTKKKRSTRTIVYSGATIALAVYWLVLRQKEEWVKRVTLSSRSEQALKDRLLLAGPVHTTRDLRVEMRNLRTLFGIMADDATGRIPVESLTTTFFQLYAEPTATIDLVTVFDRDSSGSVDFKEFVFGLCMLRRFREVSEGTAKASRFTKLMFELIDFQDTGSISTAELTAWIPAARALSLLPPSIAPPDASTEDVVARILETYDTNKDGKLSLEEYTALHQELCLSHFIKPQE